MGNPWTWIEGDAEATVQWRRSLAWWATPCRLGWSSVKGKPTIIDTMTITPEDPKHGCRSTMKCGTLQAVWVVGFEWIICWRKWCQPGSDFTAWWRNRESIITATWRSKEVDHPSSWLLLCYSYVECPVGLGKVSREGISTLADSQSGSINPVRRGGIHFDSKNKHGWYVWTRGSVGA